jgi:hypothetical protein
MSLPLLDPVRRPGPAPTPPADEVTGLPGSPTWRRVYLGVLGCLVLYIVLLAVFSRFFA